MPHHRKKCRSVRILNPLSGPGWTSNRRANSYVACGQAEWVGLAIRFIECDPRRMTVRVSIDDDYARAAHSGFAGLDALRNLPMVGPVEKLYVERKRRAA